MPSNPCQLFERSGWVFGLAFLLACTPSRPPLSKRLIVSVPEGPTGREPLDKDSLYSTLVFKHTSMPFASRGNHTTPAAKSWRWSADFRSLTVELKDGKWSDGVVLKASDFVYGWKKLLLNAKQPHLVAPLLCIDQALNVRSGADPSALGLLAVGEKTLEIKFAQPCPGFLETIDSPYLGPRRQDVDLQFPSAGTNPNAYRSVGPYRLTAWQEGKAIFLEENPYYIGPHPEIPSIEIKFTDATTTNIDMAADISLRERPLSASGTGYSVQEILQNEGIGLVFPDKDQPFDNKLVRRAFSLALNRRTLQENLPSGFVAETSVNAPGPGYSILAGFGFNPAMAKTLFQKAGFSDTAPFPPFTITVPQESRDLDLLADRALTQIRAILEIKEPVEPRPSDLKNLPKESKHKGTLPLPPVSIPLILWKTTAWSPEFFWKRVLDIHLENFAGAPEKWARAAVEDQALFVPIARKYLWIAWSRNIEGLSFDEMGLPLFSSTKPVNQESAAKSP